MEKLNYPKTILEAVDILLHVLPEAELQVIKTMLEDDLVILHIGLGKWIRNNLGLWQENYELLGDCGAKNPDDASNVIINALQKKLNE